ncbi:MAG: response regulator, partial [Bacteroidota bacterium]
MRSFILIVIFVFFLIIEATGQEPRFDRFDVSSGLSQNNINGLVIDDQGNVWAGTLDGLNRYNGYEFEIFKPGPAGKNHISGNHITAMGKGKGGDVWIHTRGGGLDLYDAATGHFTHFNDSVFEKAGLSPSNNLHYLGDSLVVFSDGDALGIFDVDRKECSAIQMPGYVYDLDVRKERVLICGDFGIRQYRPDLRRDKKLVMDLTDSTDVASYRLVGEEGEILAVTEGSISSFGTGLQEEEEIVSFGGTQADHFDISTINSFAVRDSVFWLGGPDLLMRIARNNDTWAFEKFEYDPANDFSFKGHHVTSLEFDSMGNLWIGTLKNGLNLFNYEKNLFSHYSWSSQSLMSPDADPVRALCKTRSGDIWLGFDRKGIGTITSSGDHKYYSHFYTSDGHQEAIENVRALFQDSEGNLWIGEDEQLCIYNQRKDRVEAVDVRFSWDWPFKCYSVKEFDQGRVVISARHQLGFVDLQSGNLEIMDFEEFGADVSGTVRDFVRDRADNWWVAKDERGILKFSPDGNVQYIRESSHGLSDNKVYSMISKGENLWIGTNSGLNLFHIPDDTVATRYFETDGLSNNIIYSVYMDEDNHLWMSTNRGITRFDPEKEHFKTYLANDFFMDDAHFSDDAGRIYYGGYTGVVAFHPGDIRMKDVDVVASLEQFRLFNEEVVPGASVDGRVLFQNPLNATDEIRLKHDQNSFSIRFNGYPFDYPNHNRYRYRLRGLQDEWIYTEGSNRQASYSAVPPGHYTFQVQAAPFQREFGSVKALDLTVVPPFWQTSWFKVLLLLLLIGAVWMGFQVRSRQIRKRNLLLKTRVEEQTRELKEQNHQIVEMSEQLHQADQSKLRFFTNVSHDFRTPLTLILAHLDNLEENREKAVRAIRDNAYRLLRMINQLIDIRKLDQNQMKLEVSCFDLIPFVTSIIDSFRTLGFQKNIELVFRSSSDSLLVWLDHDKMEKILYNLLTNAIKYSPEGKSVTISVFGREDNFSLEVEDEGIGLPPEKVEQIFDRYFRSGTGRNQAPGDGIGLSIVKGLTEIQKGKIIPGRGEKGGAKFELIFPRGKDFFEKEEIDKEESNDFLMPSFKSDSNAEIKDAGSHFAGSSLQKLGGQNILVVEDNDELAGFLKNTLNAYFVVKTATNGREALQIMDRFMPALIISDIMMPVMDGIEFCKHLKNDIHTSHIPVILLTAKVDTDTHVEGFELGVDDYIEKPFNARILMARIKSLLENREKLKRYFEEQAGFSSSDVAISERDRKFLSRVEEIINEKYADPHFNVENLSEMMAMSRSSFYRKFSDLTG